jgi:hypothetical protein
MTEHELYARARIVFLSRPEARICLRPLDHPRGGAYVCVAEPCDGAPVFSRAEVYAEWLDRDDVMTVETQLKRLRRVVAQTVSERNAAASYR